MNCDGQLAELKKAQKELQDASEVLGDAWVAYSKALEAALLDDALAVIGGLLAALAGAAVRGPGGLIAFIATVTAGAAVVLRSLREAAEAVLEADRDWDKRFAQWQSANQAYADCVAGGAR